MRDYLREISQKVIQRIDGLAGKSWVLNNAYYVIWIVHIKMCRFTKEDCVYYLNLYVTHIL
jgi:hypothetical protein